MKNNPLESLSKYHTGLCYYDVTLKRKSQGFLFCFLQILFDLCYIFFSHHTCSHISCSGITAPLCEIITEANSGGQNVNEEPTSFEYHYRTASESTNPLLKVVLGERKMTEKGYAVI